MARYHTFAATISNSQSLSGAIAIPSIDPDMRPVALKMSAGWDAAAITFQSSIDGGSTFANLYDSAGNEVSMTVAAGRMVYLPEAVRSLVWFKIRSGTSGTPVNQTADRSLEIFGAVAGV